MRLFLAPLILLGLPLAEIAGFVIVGKAIGLWATLGLIILTSILGGVLLRSQGMHLLRQISTEGREGRAPGRALIDGAMIVVAGILLLLPGFITDIIGIALFLPFVRSFLWSLIGRRVVVMRSPGQASYRYESPRPTPTDGNNIGSKAPVVDLDEEDFHRNPDPSSPWSAKKSDEP
jgi:UPF0716 protein FxsA